MKVRTYIPRRKWEPRAQRRGPMATPAREAYIHHSVTNEPEGHNPKGPKPPKDATPAQEEAHMRLLESIGLGQGHGGISYNFVVFDSGRIYEGQGWGVTGTHTYNHNSIGHGICFAGNFLEDRPTKEAIAAVKALQRRGIFRRKMIRAYRLFGHNEVPGGQASGATACPGTHITAHLNDMYVGSRKTRR